ncbi:oligonucleotide/oligosaccharide-binding-fold domain-containing protein, partial [Treponema sp. R6D11]
VNVTAQLEEIISKMKIPVHQRAQPLSSSEIDDYLCCIGRGMIQFVCIRERGHGDSRAKIGSYRSLTADKIIIHPGSVMFRMDPQFIVAGEIVRTSKMYAMSVSPLSKEVLNRIRPGLFSGDADGKFADGREKQKKTRDFTNNIKISGEVFDIINVKGKKTVILPWEKLERIKNNLSGERGYKNIKGKIIVKNQYNLLAGEKLSLILSLAP